MRLFIALCLLTGACAEAPPKATPRGKPAAPVDVQIDAKEASATVVVRYLVAPTSPPNVTFSTTGGLLLERQLPLGQAVASGGKLTQEYLLRYRGAQAGARLMVRVEASFPSGVRTKVVTKSFGSAPASKPTPTKTGERRLHIVPSTP